jgi:hypothetical protein
LIMLTHSVTGALCGYLADTEGISATGNSGHYYYGQKY